MCHRHCIGGDILLVCHVVLQEHMIKESCDFWWEPLMASTILPCLVALGNVEVEICF